MTTFKYLKVVENVVPSKKEPFSILECHINDTQLDLILPLHGLSAEDASQTYLYLNKSKPSVYVRKYLPETKYETYVDELHYKVARRQLELFQKEESERISKQKLENMLKEF